MRSPANCALIFLLLSCSEINYPNLPHIGTVTPYELGLSRCTDLNPSFAYVPHLKLASWGRCAGSACRYMKEDPILFAWPNQEDTFHQVPTPDGFILYSDIANVIALRRSSYHHDLPPISNIRSFDGRIIDRISGYLASPPGYIPVRINFSNAPVFEFVTYELASEKRDVNPCLLKHND